MFPFAIWRQVIYQNLQTKVWFFVIWRLYVAKNVLFREPAGPRSLIFELRGTPENKKKNAQTVRPLSIRRTYPKYHKICFPCISLAYFIFATNFRICFVDEAKPILIEESLNFSEMRIKKEYKCVLYNTFFYASLMLSHSTWVCRDYRQTIIVTTAKLLRVKSNLILLTWDFTCWNPYDIRMKNYCFPISSLNYLCRIWREASMPK